jgi:predicted nucleic-acid-binding Zn-ribbon protein
MTNCPKCGHDKIIGPRYRNDTEGKLGGKVGEYLKYTCAQCGYSENKPTFDKPKSV